MNARNIALILLVSMVVTPGIAQEISLPLPFRSVAVADDALACYINPAGMGYQPGISAYYLRGYRGIGKGRTSLVLAGYGSGIGLQMIEGGDNKVWRWTLASTETLGEKLAVGVAYNSFSAEDDQIDKLKIWDVGLMYRTSSISLGAMFRRVNRPKLNGEKMDQDFTLAAAIRPLGHRFTLSVDTTHTWSSEDWHTRLGAEIVPVEGITFRGEIDRNRDYSVSLSIDFAHIGFGTYNAFSSDRKPLDAVGYVNLSSAVMSNLLARKASVIRMDANNALRCLTQSRTDGKIAGALLNLDDLDFSLGNCQELEQAITRFQDAGKKVFAYSSELSTGGYLVASACDRIIMHPIGELRVTGLRLESVFLAELLDRIGVDPQISRVGEYKSATEMFTETSMSPASREMENDLLDDLYDQVVSTIAENRGLSPEKVKEIIDNAPYSSAKAERLGLIDETAYADEIEDLIKLELGDVDLIDGEDYLEREKVRRDWSVDPRIAVITARGTMVTGSSFTNPLGEGEFMGSETISEMIRENREDDSIRGIVIRVDSGGGMVTAADEIWREITLTKEVKPVVVSMGDIAASGGYYMSAPANYIFAQPGTLTGSIGVYSGLPNTRRLYRNLGINKEVLQRGRNADFYSSWSPQTEERRKAFQSHVEELYSTFVEKVAAGRSMDYSRVDRIARGRVWTGRQAHKLGLVDELGGEEDAVRKAAQLAGISPDRRVDVIYAEPPGSLTRMLTEKLVEATKVPRLLRVAEKFASDSVNALFLGSIDIR